MRMAINPKTTANITTGERSLNLIKRTVPVTKAAIPDIIVHVPSVIARGVPTSNPNRFHPFITTIRSTTNTADKPPAHFPSFVLGTIFLPSARLASSWHPRLRAGRDRLELHPAFGAQAVGLVSGRTWPAFLAYLRPSPLNWTSPS